jgi:hypothetical protein
LDGSIRKNMRIACETNLHPSRPPTNDADNSKFNSDLYKQLHVLLACDTYCTTVQYNFPYTIKKERIGRRCVQVQWKETRRVDLTEMGCVGVHKIQLKMTVFWVVAPCSLIEIGRRFKGTNCRHHQDNDEFDGPAESFLYSETCIGVGLPVSCRIASQLSSIWFGILCRRWDHRRRDARRPFRNVVSQWVPRLLFASFGMLCRRRDGKRRDARRLFAASCRMMSWGSSSVDLVLWRRRDARRLVSNFLFLMM